MSTRSFKRFFNTLLVIGIIGRFIRLFLGITNAAINCCTDIILFLGIIGLYFVSIFLKKNENNGRKWPRTIGIIEFVFAVFFFAWLIF